jgi:arylsulfatase A-like enzyme
MNVLMLVVDSLRADFCYSDQTTTPTLDSFREDAVTFEQAIAGSSWTAPSMSSIFSGIYPHRLGMFDFGASYPEGVEPVFKTLSDAGYKVGSFVFDEEHLFQAVPSANVVDNFRDFEKPKDWIRDNAEEDFFLFVHHFWVHGPYEPKDSSEAWSDTNKEILQRLRENHEEAVEWCRDKYSEAVGRMSEEWLFGLLNTLQECGVEDETLVILTGDHGEGWGERYDNPEVIDTNFHLHGKQLYDEHIHVPLVIKDPEGDTTGTTVDEQVRHVDIVPTILDRLDITADESQERDGTSLVPTLEGEEIDSRPALSATSQTGQQKIGKIAVRDPPEKLIWNIPEDDVELYDIRNDPSETRDLVNERPEDVQALRERVKIAYNEVPSTVRGDGKAVRERLRDLGYL